MSSTKTKTKYYPKFFETDVAKSAYTFLRDNTVWGDGIYSKKQKKISRKAHQPDLATPTTEVDKFIRDLVGAALVGLKLHKKYALLGTYVNYYPDGNSFCPAHSHPGQVQLIISLGTAREFLVGTKKYNMGGGDVIIFGSSTHSIPIQPEINRGRISIATFMIPI